MIIKRHRPDNGIFFAIWPRWTPEGWACFEWLHYEFIEGTWGGGSTYRYARFVSDELYDKGVRRNFEATT